MLIKKLKQKQQQQQKTPNETRQVVRTCEELSGLVGVRWSGWFKFFFLQNLLLVYMNDLCMYYEWYMCVDTHAMVYIV